MEAACSRELNRSPSERPQLPVANRTVSSRKKPAQRNRPSRLWTGSAITGGCWDIAGPHAHGKLPLARDAVLQDMHSLAGMEGTARAAEEARKFLDGRARATARIPHCAPARRTAGR